MVAIEAIDDFNRFDPMEVIATRAEVDGLLARHPGAAVPGVSGRPPARDPDDRRPAAQVDRRRRGAAVPRRRGPRRVLRVPARRVRSAYAPCRT